MAAIGALGCVPSTPAEPIHPEPSDGARGLLTLAFSRPVTLADNFVLRPDEFSAVTPDHARAVLYAGGRGGTLLALDDESGEVRWELQLGGPIASQGILAEFDETGRAKVLLIGTDNGQLVAVDLDTHEPRWTYQTDGRIRNRPVVNEGVAYFVNSRDQVFALDLATSDWRGQYGQELTTEFTVYGHAGLTFVPSTDPSASEAGILYTCFDNGKVVAVGASSMSALWIASVAPPEGGGFVDCDSTPLVDPVAGELIVTGQSTGLWGLSLEDGAERWRYPVRGASTVSVAPDGAFLLSSSLEGVMAVERGGRLRWRQQVDPGVLSVPVVVGNTVFVAHSESGLFAFDAATGTYLARVFTGSGMSGVPVYDPGLGRFYAASNRGVLFAFVVSDDA